MQYTPHVHVSFALDVEEHVRKSLQRPRAQTRELEFDRIPRRARAWMGREVASCLLERGDETECGPVIRVVAIPIERVLDVLSRTLAKDNPDRAHSMVDAETRARRLARNASSTSTATDEDTPSMRSSRSCERS